MVTIRELAAECGCSKTYIMQQIDKLGYREQLQKKGNKIIVPTNISNEIKKSLKSKNTGSQQAEQQQAEQLQNDIIDLLSRELTNKDNQISKLLEQVDHLQRQNAELVAAVREANTLHAGTMQIAAAEITKETLPTPESNCTKNWISRLFSR